MWKREKDGPRCDTGLDGESSLPITYQQRRKTALPFVNVYDPFTIDTTGGNAIFLTTGVAIYPNECSLIRGSTCRSKFCSQGFIKLGSIFFFFFDRISRETKFDHGYIWFSRSREKEIERNGFGFVPLRLHDNILNHLFLTRYYSRRE